MWGIIALFLVLVSYLCMSLYNILIGKGIVKHVMYDTDERKKYIFKKGLIGLIAFGCLIIYLVVLIVYYLNKF